MSQFNPRLGFSVKATPTSTPDEVAGRLQALPVTAVELNQPYIQRFGKAVDMLQNHFEVLTYHLPHDKNCSVLNQDPKRDKLVLNLYREELEKAMNFGCTTFTFHLKNIMRMTLDEYWERSVEFAQVVAEMAKELGVTICVENCFPVVRNATVARKFMDEVNCASLGLTLDTGHFWSARCEDDYGCYLEDPLRCTAEGAAILNRMCCEMIEVLPEKIFHMHIHNLRSDDWRDHQPVPQGIMDYRKILSSLQNAGYNSTIIIEIRPEFGWQGISDSAKYVSVLMQQIL